MYVYGCIPIYCTFTRGYIYILNTIFRETAEGRETYTTRRCAIDLGGC